MKGRHWVLKLQQILPEGKQHTGLFVCAVRACDVKYTLQVD